MKKALTIVLILLAVSLLSGTVSAAGGQKALVNINNATIDQLQLLPRVGPSLAQRIVDFRTKNGPFQSIDEIQTVRGVGEHSLENMRPYLCIKGATTLTEKVKIPRAKKSTD